MSAFAVIYDRSGGPLEPGLLERAMERLSHRGPDGQDTLASGPLAMGHWHFWTTPEEVGERQPLHLDGLPFTLVFDGRLDNREDLFAALSISAQEDRSLSDAALVLRAYAAWGESCVEHFIGEFAMALFDERSHTLFCARDRLGDRTLFYALCGNLFVIASEPSAVVGVSTNSPEVDEFTVCNFFVDRASADGHTFFKGVTELLPAYFMMLGETKELRFSRYWEPDFSYKLRYKSDIEYVEHFRALLVDSVLCHLRSVTSTGVMMSGGLDSTSLASISAEMLAPQRLTTFSYVFNEIYECDEQVYIDAVHERWNTKSVKIFADDAWPFQNLDNLYINPNHPDISPYRILKNRMYKRIRQEGIQTIISGEFGDHLFAGGIHWLVDLLADRKFSELWQLLLSCKTLGFQKIIRHGFLQTTARTMLNSIPGGKNLRRPHVWPCWLTSFSIQNLHHQENYPRHNVLLGSMSPLINFLKGHDANYHGVDERHPFHNQHLIDFALATPAYYLQRGSITKYLLRESMVGILPEPVRMRKDKTTILSLRLRGMSRERNTLAQYLESPAQAWHQFVDAEKLKTMFMKQEYLTYPTIFWLCISYQLWYQRFIESGGSHE